MNILLTGGAGYIGSHTLIELDKAGHSVVVVDNFYNSQPEAIRRVEKIIGHKVTLIEADIRDREAMNKVFTEHKIDAVINFAGLKAVGESVAKPLMYYETNMNGVFVLLDVMRQHCCKNIIFSSSATVYGDPAIIPITEECPKGQCTNPYGWTKSMIEQVLMDVQKADPEWNVVLLRYFNPIGAHESGLIGANPNGIPNNLMPYITQTAVSVRNWECLAMIMILLTELEYVIISMSWIWQMVMFVLSRLFRRIKDWLFIILVLVTDILFWML